MRDDDAQTNEDEHDAGDHLDSGSHPAGDGARQSDGRQGRKTGHHSDDENGRKDGNRRRRQGQTRGQSVDAHRQ